MTEMTYEERALCPLCKSPLEIIERKTLPNIGSVLVCRCARCGHLATFSESKLSVSTKSRAESLREDAPDNSQ